MDQVNILSYERAEIWIWKTHGAWKVWAVVTGALPDINSRRFIRDWKIGVWISVAPSNVNKIDIGAQ